MEQDFCIYEMQKCDHELNCSRCGTKKRYYESIRVKKSRKKRMPRAIIRGEYW